MTTAEWVLVAGLVVNTLGLGIVLFKLVWGSGTNLQMQFASTAKEFFERIMVVRDEWSGKFDSHSSNFGQVVQNINDRMHQIELAAMESRAIAAETYMRRESYYRATEELKRDTQASHADLKKEMHAGFQKLETQVDELAKTVNTHQRRGGA